MAGFMAGFGTAFANSFNQASAERARREDDLVRMKFEDMQATKKERQKLKAEDLKNVRLAKSLTEGVNPAAWPKVHEWLASGMSESQVIKNLQEGEFIIKPKTGENAAEAAQTQDDGSGSVDLSKTAEGAVDSQMAASGLGSKPGQGIFGKTPAPGLNGEAPATPDESRANRRVDEATGGEYSAPQDESVSVAEDLPGSDASIEYRPKKPAADISKIDSPEGAMAAATQAQQEGKPELAKEYLLHYERQMMVASARAHLKAIENGTAVDPMTATQRETGTIVQKSADGTWVTPDGKVLGEADVVPHDKRIMDGVTKVVEQLDKPVQEYTVRVEKFAGAVRTANEMVEIVDADPRVLSLKGDIAKTVSTWRDNIFGAGELFHDTVPVTQSTLDRLEETEASIEAELANPMKNFDDTTIRRNLLEAKAARMAYAMAAFDPVNQTGKAVSAGEFESALRNLLPTNATAFKRNLSDAIGAEEAALREQETNISKNSLWARDFEKRFGIPFPYPLATPVDDLVDLDQLGKFKKMNDIQTDAEPDTSIVGEDPNDPAPPGIDPEDWKYMDEGQKKLWR